MLPPNFNPQWLSTTLRQKPQLSTWLHISVWSVLCMLPHFEHIFPLSTVLEVSWPSVGILEHTIHLHTSGPYPYSSFHTEYSWPYSLLVWCPSFFQPSLLCHDLRGAFSGYLICHSSSCWCLVCPFSRLGLNKCLRFHIFICWLTWCLCLRAQPACPRCSLPFENIRSPRAGTVSFPLLPCPLAEALWEKVPNKYEGKWEKEGGRKEISEKGDAFPGSPVPWECGQCVLLSPSITVQV